MIHIIFLPGTFGSTINHVLKTYTQQKADLKVDSKFFLTNDGSMHLADKNGHWQNSQELMNFFNNEIDQNIEISTPFYPLKDLHANEIIELFKKFRPNDRYIFIYVDNIASAELNMLMQYYKIAKGILNMSIDLFCNSSKHNIINWDLNYTHWSQMQTWELREWLSLFYIDWVNEWTEAKNYVPDSWLKLNAADIIENPYDTFIKVCDYYDKFNLEKERELDEFAILWKSKQQYIIDEYTLINKIVNSAINNNTLNWKKLNIVSESMIQQKLRAKGYEIKCYDLNNFPTNAKKLHTLLKKI